MWSSCKQRSSRPSRQRGIVLIVALIVLVVMALVGLGMMRQTSSGVSIAGNVAFRQNGLSAGDYGTNQAYFWLQNAGGSTLNADQTANGYYSTWNSNTDGDPTTLNWATGAFVALDSSLDPTQNTVQYIIQRLCAVPGPSDAIGQQCSINSDQPAANGSKGGYLVNYGSAGNTNVPPPLYRISARVQGPKNTISYTQIIVE